MSFLGRLLALTLGLLTLPALPHAFAAGASPTTLQLSAPATVRRGAVLPLTATLSTDGAAPVAGVPVAFERDAGAGWLRIGTATTGADGRARLVVPAPARASYRATYAGNPAHQPAASAVVTVDVVVVSSAITLGGTAVLVDEHRGTLRIRWSGADALAVRGRARLWLHEARRPWRAGPVLATDANGLASVPVRPRVDTWYQVRGDAGPGWTKAASRVWRLDNRPPGRVVVLPAAAPRPEPLPAQRRAVGAGAAVKVSGIPLSVWRSMVGRSWRSGCPVGRSGLRLLQTNYWGFDGYRQRGQLVVATGVVDKFVVAMRRLYAARIPIRAMYLPDRFGYSSRSGGADDFASMAHDNTSAFNCRWVTGWGGRRSPHSWGRSFDLDPFENPFHSAVGWLPNAWWIGRSDPTYAWRSARHRVVRIMRASGFRWTYPASDPQHFDA